MAGGRVTEHLCVTCSALRPGDPRVYERPNVCQGCRSRLRSLLSELLDAYAQVELVKGSSAGAKVSGSRTPPLPLSVGGLDLTLPPHGTVEDDLVPLYEAVEVEMAVWTRPVRPTEAEEYGTETVVMRQTRRARHNGYKAYGPSGDQIGGPSVVSVLDSWARDWQTYAWVILPDPTVSALTRWLGDRLEWACDHHPAVDDFADELRTITATVRAAAGLTRPTAELKLGVPCRDCERLTLFRWPGSDYVECGSCPVLMTPAEYTRWTQLISAPEWRGWVQGIVDAA